MYRKGLKSGNMIAGEAKSKRTNSFPLLPVVGVYVTSRLRELICFPVLKCGHVDLDNAASVKSSLFWRDGWKQSKLRCRSCADPSTSNMFFTKCECAYREMLIKEARLLDDLADEIEKLPESGFRFGFNLFAADCRTLDLSKK